MGRQHASIPIYFTLRVACALILLKLSTQYLTVQEFANFAQLVAFAALLNMAVIAGAHNGLIREAAAADDDDALARVHSAGLAIWLAAVALLGVPIAALSRQIAEILTGSQGYWPLVIAVAALALAAGPGQVSWSILSGRKLVAQSLGAQGLGLAVGTAASAWFIVQRDFAGAALAFACGPVAGTIAALPFALRLPLRWRARAEGVRRLLDYSAAMASVIGFSALVLFALRWHYRESFGATELGYWVAANRISDMSTQLLGLVMLQLFVPQFAKIDDPGERLRLMLRYGIVGAVLTGTALIVFMLAGRPLIHLFLSDSYIAAIPAIRLYLLGDFLRVWASVAMFAALAAGRPGGYAAIEIGTLTVMAALTVMLTAAGEVRAPLIGYAGAYAVTAAALGLLFWLRLRSPSALLRPSQLPLHGARRTAQPGTAAPPQ